MAIYRFTWDPAKAEANWRKHGITFPAAMRVFDDPLHVSRMERYEGGEYRWQTIGHVNPATLLLVVHRYLDENLGAVVRIVSARKVTRHERKNYEDEDG
ncbi:MAG: BrnT family toxin [Gemmobacter sp.]